jgi:Zn-dependent membrane protease YugP
MHSFRSESAIKRLRFAALLVCMKCLLAPAAVLILVYSVLIHDDSLTNLAIVLVGLTVLMTLLQWIVALRTQCPLCMTPVMASKGCSKHSQAKTILASHRLRVALFVLFRGWFRCPYCNEPSELRVRTRRRR